MRLLAGDSGLAVMSPRPTQSQIYRSFPPQQSIPCKIRWIGSSVCPDVILLEKLHLSFSLKSFPSTKTFILMNRRFAQSATPAWQKLTKDPYDNNYPHSDLSGFRQYGLAGCPAWFRLAFHIPAAGCFRIPGRCRDHPDLHRHRHFQSVQQSFGQAIRRREDHGLQYPFDRGRFVRILPVRIFYPPLSLGDPLWTGSRQHRCGAK